MAKPKAAKKFIGLRIDIETRSGTDISAGSYRYAEDPEFAVLIIAYSRMYRYPGGAIRLAPVRELDMSSYDERSWFRRVIADERFQKHAFNANFERIALSKWYGLPNGTYFDPRNWRCSAVQANVHGVFGTLDDVGKAVRARVTKDKAGKALIRFFSVPMNERDQKRALVNCGCVRFHSPAAHPEDFRRFVDYCKQDVTSEAMAAAAFPPIEDERQAEYEADQRVNDRGVRHFATLARAAVAQVEVEKDRLMGELKVLTGVANPNSNQQMQGWLADQGYPMGSLDKAHREEALADPLCPPKVARALTLKGSASLSSVAKHNAALKARCSDGRIRGMLGYYGAHTGREAGRLMQPQNLPRYEAPDADRRRLLQGLAGPEAPRIAKGTVRASLVPARGHVFVTIDYNAIEARVLGWLCGERWVNEEFSIGQGKIYEATAAQMGFMDKDRLIAGLKACGKCGLASCKFCEIRGRGKVSNLALGFAGGPGALVTMGAEEAGIDIGNYKELNAEWKAAGMPCKFHEWERDRHDYPELIRLRDAYRNASPATTRFWKLCAKAWDLSALQAKPVRFGDNGVLRMVRDGRHNRLILPNDRSIWYRFARSFPSDTNPEHIDRRTYIGKSKGIGHTRVDTHGGKLTENVTQAVARDVLFDLLLKMEAMTAKGWPARLVLHVHDEVVLETPVKHADQVLADGKGLMSTPPNWAPGLAVQGAGGIMERYRK